MLSVVIITREKIPPNPPLDAVTNASTQQNSGQHNRGHKKDDRLDWHARMRPGAQPPREKSCSNKIYPYSEQGDRAVHHAVRDHDATLACAAFPRHQNQRGTTQKDDWKNLKHLPRKD